jgi:hypothetical protein
MTAALVSTGWTGPDEVRRGSAYVFQLQVNRAGEIVPLSAATIRVLDRTGTVKASGTASISIDGIASVTMAGSITENEDPQLGWTVEWSATDDDGNAFVLVNPVDIVMYTVVPSVKWDDLVALHPDLTERLASGDDVATAKATAQSYIEQAWYRVREKLRARGNRATLIVDSYSLRGVHLYETLSDIFRGLMTANDVAEQTMAEYYAAKAMSEWDTMTFEVMDPSTYSRTLAARSSRPGLSLGSSRTTVFRPFAGIRWSL